MSDLVGRSLGRYEIVGLIGAGGMGEVYRARDTQLDRLVAVKVVSSDAATSTGAIKRFEREARTVAQLSHPNILEIYDFGREESVVFAVTELLEGSDLRARTRGRRLPLSKVLEIGIAVATGLSAAHSKGIVHRDVKPENVFVTSSGQVKILDFGIAGLRAAAPEDEGSDPDARTETLTRPGTLVGTVGYMSPEQVRGELVDSRSDIFALGCLLYEMLVGQRAFQGETSDATLQAILDQDPEPISEARPDVSPALEMLVARCLEKQPDERFESARDVAFALQALTGARRALASSGEVQAARRSRRMRAVTIAALVVVIGAVVVWMATAALRQPPPLPERLTLGVPPFETPGANDSLGNFAEGLRLGLLDDLALIAQQEQGIEWVVPAGEAARANALTAARLGSEFGVSAVIAGRLESLGDTVRMTLDVVAPATEELLRSVVVEDVLSNVEAFQHGPSLELAQVLDVAIAPETRQRIHASSANTTGAFDLFASGRGALARAETADEFEAAAALIDGVADEDPLFACGWVLRARSRLALFEASNDPMWLERGTADAERALDLTGRREAAWRVLGALRGAAGEPDVAIEALEAGMRIAPNDADLRLDLAGAYQRVGRPEDAEQETRRAIYLRPDYWIGYDRLARLYLEQGDFEAAAVEFGHVIGCAPDFALGYVKLAGVYMYLERPDAAGPLLERSLEIEETPWALTNLGSIHFDSSRFARAAEYYRASTELQPDNWVFWGNLGYAYSYGVVPEMADDAFRRAVDLAGPLLAENPDDLDLAARLAGYHAMLGEKERGLELIDAVAAAEPTNPMIIPVVAETYEDLGERERALEWVERSFAAGVSPERFEGRPTLGKLIADERYRALVPEDTGAS